MTVAESFVSSALKHEGKTLFNFKKAGQWERATYGGFLKDVKAIAGRLAASGLGKGDAAAIAAENRPEWCAAYLAVLMCGASAVPVSAESTQEEISNILEDSGAKAVFFSLATKGLFEGLSEGMTAVDFDSAGFEEILKGPALEKPTAADTEDLASLLYTSGTTGRPKGVMLSNGNLLSDALAVINTGVITGGDNVLSVLPLHHTYPFMCTFLVPLLLGASVTFSPSLKGPEILAASRDTGATVLLAVPRLLEILRDGIIAKIKKVPLMPKLVSAAGFIRKKTGLNAGRFLFGPVHRTFGKSLRLLASGGAKLSPDIMEDLEALGFTVLEGYGLTETSPVVTFNPVEKRKPGSAGKPLSTVEIKILRPSETGEGEVAIRGPMLMKGYYKNPQETAGVMDEGFFLSGDLGYIDREGYLFLTGRAKEIIVLSSGKNVYPEDVEKAYMKLPLVKEICVLAPEGKGGAESLRAVIVPDMDEARDRKLGNVREAIRWELETVRLPSYMRVKAFTVHDGPLPKTPLGKLRRFMIKDLLRPISRPKATDPSLLEDPVGRAVIKCIHGALKEEIPVSPSDNLEIDIGIDSLRRLELMAALEELLSVELPDALSSEVLTVGELVQKIKTLGSAPPAKEKAAMASFLEAMPPEEDKKRAGLSPGPGDRMASALFMALNKLVFRVFFGLRVEGAENLPPPPFIIAPNHTSYLDAFIVAAGLPSGALKKTHFQGAEEFFRSPLAALFGRIARVIPVDREGLLERAFRTSAFILREGKALCIFPEGGRSATGRLMEFKRGIGVLAVELGVPVVPARIEGAFEALPRGAAWPKFKRLRLVFGRPVRPSGEKAGAEAHRAFTDEVREKVVELSSSPARGGREIP